jgi:tetratricopeptide (TPR) repeat protein
VNPLVDYELVSYTPPGSQPPPNPEFTSSTGVDYEDDIQQITALLKRHLKHDPYVHASMYLTRGRAYIEVGKIDRAIADFDEAIRVDADRQRAYVNRGEAYDKAGKYDRALSDFQKALELAPKSADAYKGMARVFSTAKSPEFRDARKAVEYGEKGVSIAEETMSLGPALGNFCHTLATAYAEAGDYDKALSLETKAYTIYEPLTEKDNTKDGFKKMIDYYTAMAKDREKNGGK